MNQRIPEACEFYNNKEQSEIFVETSTNDLLLKYFEIKFIKRILKKYKKFDDINILDLGCGSAYISTALARARADWKITAVDYSPYMIEFAIKSAKKNKVSINFINSKAEDINLEPNQFDLIISHYSFSKFENAEKVLKNIINIAKNNAYFEMVDVLRIKNHFYTSIIKKLAKIFYGNNFYQQYVNSLKGAYSFEELENFFNRPEFKKISFKCSFPIICNISEKIIK